MIVGDAANFLLGGIPGDVHDMFVMDVEPADLAQASVLLDEMSDSMRTIDVKLSGSVASLEGRWQGDGAAAFDNEIWQPLSHGLGVLDRECATAAPELARLAVQAEQAHVLKVEELNQEIQNQLWIFAGTSLIGSPELGGVISEAVGGLAARLGSALVGRIVTGIVDAISTMLRKVLDAFYSVLKWAATAIRVDFSGIRSDVARICSTWVRGSVGDNAPGLVVGQGDLARLKNAESAIVPKAKVLDYALNPDHPTGGNKARVLSAALGYDRSSAGDLIDQIRAGVRSYPPIPGIMDTYGARFTVDIPVTGPNGRTVLLRTGWIYRVGSDVPQLTTLYVL